MLAILCPGQGAQAPGMLTPWCELPHFRRRLQWLSTVADVDLTSHGTTSGQDVIRDTAVAQPLIVASGLAALAELFDAPADLYDAVDVVAGHSVGEVTGAYAAGVLGAEAAMIFVRERGRAMARASRAELSGMSAVVGGNEEEVLEAIQSFGLVAANRNSARQVVAAGRTAALSGLAERGVPGAAIKSLAVAGAFHTPFMEPAVAAIRSTADGIHARDTRLRLLSNADGRVVHSGPEALGRLVTQVANPVRWDLCMESMRDMGVTGVLELPPAGTLTGLAKRDMKGVERVALRTPDDLTAARALIEHHGGAMSPTPSHTWAPTWRLVVAPLKGLVDRSGTPETDDVAAGDHVAAIRQNRSATHVTSPHSGTIVEWLVEHGDPVSPGQPLVLLHPTGVEGY